MVLDAQLENSGETQRECLERARSLAQEALALIDMVPETTEIGARLQEVVDALDAKLNENN